MAGRILVGSCSWTDPTLIKSGRFYPRGVSSAEARLRFYSAQFPIVEVDSTYYAPPTAENAVLWAKRTPNGFVFDVKAFALLTWHMAAIDRLPPWLRDGVSPAALGKRNVYRGDVDPAALELLWLEHAKALAPLAEAGKLGAVLFQFPPWFTRTRAAIDYLAEVRERLPGWRLAVEFRGGGWMSDEAAAKTLRLLDELDLSYVSVDEPQGFDSSTPPVTAVTGGLAVLRLHGRNAATWKVRSGAASDRFRYLYRDDELEEWVPRVTELAEQAGEAHVLFNNNYEDWGMRNARRMAQLLGVSGGEGQTELGIG
jgi:uncharacterized protein YecE (DUF72 family)